MSVKLTQKEIIALKELVNSSSQEQYCSDKKNCNKNNKLTLDDFHEELGVLVGKYNECLSHGNNHSWLERYIVHSDEIDNDLIMQEVAAILARDEIIDFIRRNMLDSFDDTYMLLLIKEILVDYI